MYVIFTTDGHCGSIWMSILVESVGGKTEGMTSNVINIKLQYIVDRFGRKYSNRRLIRLVFNTKSRLLRSRITGIYTN